MTTISDKVLARIKKEHIKPRPRWQFRLRDGGQWAVFGLLVLLAVFSLSLLWYFWSDGPWLHGGSGFGMFWGRMPLVFILLVLSGGALALLDFRSTGQGYRYPIIKIALVLLLLAVAAGWGLHSLGVSQRIDQAFSASPFYQDKNSYMKGVWQRPSEGLLAGEILRVRSSASFDLRDFDGKDWQVDASGAFWRHDLAPVAGLKVKLIGRADQGEFLAKEIRPWMGPGNCGMAQTSGSCRMMR